MLLTPRISDRLHRVRCPVEVLSGESDRLIPFSNARDLKHHLPHATLTILEGVGHFLPIERPDTTVGSLVRVKDVAKPMAPRPR